MSRIVISDIHGCFKTLTGLIAKLPKDVPITFAGDFIDRGPDSRQVVQYIIDSGHDAVIGNHEEMMLEDVSFINDKIRIDHYNGAFMANGGNRTLASYYIDKEEELESGEILKTKVHDVEAIKAHMEWFRSLPHHRLYWNEQNAEGRQLLVSHSTAADVWGEYSPDSIQFKNGITWDRIPSPRDIPGIYNVFGHTPQKNGPSVSTHYAAIDGGCYFTSSDAYGKMYAIQYPEMIVYEQQNVES